MLVSCLATKTKVVYIWKRDLVLCGILYENIINLKYKIQKHILLYELLWLLTCSGNWIWIWCNYMTAFCVKLYCDKKTMTYYFTYFKESIFLYTVFPLESFPLVLFISLLVVFFTQDTLWLQLCLMYFYHIFLISSKSYLVLYWISIVNSILK